MVSDTGVLGDTGIAGDTGVMPDGSAGGTYDGTASLANVLTSTGMTTVMGGYFVAGTDIRGGIGCTRVREVAGCRQFACTALTPTDDAGTLTASVDGTEVASATAAETYVAVASGGPFSAGQTITLSTSGGTVPAFSGDVIAPPPPETTLPTTGTVGADLTFTWAASLAADEVELGLNSGTTAVLCRADASAGSLTIDGSITADFGTTASLTLKSLNITPVTAGDYEIAVIAAEGVAGMVSVE